jgi:hypothetical protein
MIVVMELREAGFTRLAGASRKDTPLVGNCKSFTSRRLLRKASFGPRLSNGFLINRLRNLDGIKIH